MQARAVLFSVLLVLPWLNPFATGPSPSVVSLLLTLGVVGGLLLVGSWPGYLFTGRSAAERSANAKPANAADLLAAAWLLAGTASSIAGVIQYFGAAAPLAPWVNATNLGEAFANLRQRNQFATLTNIALASLIWFATKPVKSAHIPRW